MSQFEVAKLEIGSIDRAHGIKGEVVVNLSTNIKERLNVGTELFLDESQKIDGLQKIIVKAARPHKKKYIVSFEGIGSRNEAEELKGQKLFAIPISLSISTSNDTSTSTSADASTPMGDLSGARFFLHELVGCEVVDQHNKSYGKVIELQPNPASDLLVLESGALVPSVFIKSVSDGKINVDAPDGLFDR